MKDRPVPTLSTDNFITDPLIKLKNIYAYFKIAEHSQSNIYLDNVISLKYIIEKNNNTNNLTSVVTEQLTILLNRYFVKSDVFCELIDNGDGSVNLKISTEVTDSKGYTHDLKDTVKIKDNKIMEDY